MTLDEVLSRLDAVRRSYMARCVAHDDRSPSLRACEGERGVLLHCYAGCSLQEICQALRVTPKDTGLGPLAEVRAIRFLAEIGALITQHNQHGGRS